MNYNRVQEYLRYDVKRLFGMSAVEWCQLTGRDRLMIIQMVNEMKIDGKEFDKKEITPETPNNEDLFFDSVCDQGHAFVRLINHPEKDGVPRCPHRKIKKKKI